MTSQFPKEYAYVASYHVFDAISKPRSVLCKVRGLILEGAELAGLAEVESDLKKCSFFGDSALCSRLKNILH